MKGFAKALFICNSACAVFDFGWACFLADCGRPAMALWFLALSGFCAFAAWSVRRRR